MRSDRGSEAARRRPRHVLVAIGDRGRAESLARELAEHPALVAATLGDLDAPAEADLVVSEHAPIDATTPHVVLGGDAAGEPNVLAVLPATAEPDLVAAAALLVAAGFRVVAPIEAPGEAGDGAPARVRLSPRESEVLALLADGASNKIIARRLGISQHTAKFHVASLLAKLHAHNRADAIAIAMRNGLLMV